MIRSPARKPVIGVIGGHNVPKQTVHFGEALGAAIAEAGWILLNGGRDEGVMGATARGAKAAGGVV